MSAYIKELKDADGNILYPVTKASAVYFPNGRDTVERYLVDADDISTDISFETNKITKTLGSGSTVETVFSTGQIVETTKAADGTEVKKKTTTFNSDGTISIRVV